MKKKREQTRHGTVAAACEPLEQRVMLSKATVVDAGEYYWSWNPNQKIGLLRATDQVVVGVSPMSAKRRQRLLEGLTAKTGPLAGYRYFQDLGTSAWYFVRTARGYSPSYDSLNRRMAEFPALNYFAPSFIQTIDNGRVAVTDELEVDLGDNVNKSTFFGNEFANIRAAQGTNAWDARLMSGGGLEIVHRVMAMHGNPSVEHAIPNFSIAIWPSSVTGQKTGRATFSLTLIEPVEANE